MSPGLPEFERSDSLPLKVQPIASCLGITLECLEMQHFRPPCPEPTESELAVPLNPQAIAMHINI